MKPYYSDSLVTLYHGDCREILPQLDVKVDLAWYDPPYNVGKDYGPTWNDNMLDEDYFSFMSSVIEQIDNIARANCVFVPTKYALWYWNMLGHNHKQIILSWTPEGTFRGGFINQFSFLLTNATPVSYTKNVWHNCQTPGLGYFFREDTFGHPGYTSEDVTARVINAFTTAGQTVIDPFVGTGTTAKVASILKRRCIGIEISEKYLEIAANRLNKPIPLFDPPVQLSLDVRQK